MLQVQKCWVSQEVLSRGWALRWCDGQENGGDHQVRKGGDPLSRHSVGEITAGILHSTRTSVSRRCCSAIVQHHTKDLFGSVPLITSNWAVTLFLSFSFPLSYLFFSSRSCQRGTSGPQAGSSRKWAWSSVISFGNPPLTEGNSRGAEWASKDILVLISQVTVINWCDCILLQIKQLHSLCCYKNFK